MKIKIPRNDVEVLIGALKTSRAQSKKDEYLYTYKCEGDLITSLITQRDKWDIKHGR